MSSPATQDDLKEISDQLKKIEDKIGSKWTVPVVVAVIAGLLTVANGVIQVRLENANVIESERRKKADELARQNLSQNIEFFTQVDKLGREVRRVYREQCSGRRLKSQEPVIDALDKFDELVRQHRLRVNQDYIGEFLKYGSFVGNTVIDGCGRDDEQPYNSFSAKLEEFYKSECQFKPEPAQPLGITSLLPL